jgi:7-cyano-7-deazaguanine synthase
VAVLASGGLDSSVMLAQLSESFQEVHPTYVSCGLVWETAEQEFLREFIFKLGNPRVGKIRVLTFPTTDLYGKQWFTSGEGIPGYHDPDQEWEIPGRNIILLAKAAVWARLNGISHIGLGALASNPFPDATEEFFSSAEATLSLGLSWPIKVLRPFTGMRKAQIISLGSQLPLELTLSCAQPDQGRHCGVCGKCRERIEAFAEADIPDPTVYLKTYSDGLCSAS